MNNYTQQDAIRTLVEYMKLALDNAGFQRNEQSNNDLSKVIEAFVVAPIVQQEQITSLEDFNKILGALKGARYVIGIQSDLNSYGKRQLNRINEAIEIMEGKKQ